MKMLTICSIACCLLLFTSCVAKEPLAAVVWEVKEEVSAPESAYFDADSGCVFVSHMGRGGPAKKDGEGYISKLSANGQVVAARWITGLNAPKGLRSHAGRLWVSDIDQLVEIDIAQGRILRRMDVPGAQFLNDVACDAEGAVYAADTFGRKIYRCRADRVEVFAEGEEVENPNGLLVVDDALLVAAWGRGDGDVSGQAPGHLFALDLKTARKSLVTSEPLGNLDGLERVAEGRYLVSDWISGKILYVTRSGARLVMQLPKGAADIGYIPDQRVLIVPQMLENRVTAFQLTQPEKPTTGGRGADRP